MKVGIVTFVRCGNYGAELQAYALQYVLNHQLEVDAEVIDLKKDSAPQHDAIKKAIKNRLAYYGILRGSLKILELIVSKYQAKKKKGYDAVMSELRKQRFESFFQECIKHSERHYHVSDLRGIRDIPWDVLITGSDQVWNFRQTNYLDVYFLKFGKGLGAKTIAYAPSFGFSEIPADRFDLYQDLLGNIDCLSVREANGIEMIKKCCHREAVQVLDPTLLLNREQWVENIGIPEIDSQKNRYVIIYTITGSKYIYRLAKSIAQQLHAQVVNIKGDYSKDPSYRDIVQVKDAGPREFISLMNQAVYVITDSFHGTAFSANFNIPFTTLLNPASNNNSRVISLLTSLHLSDRYMYDDGKKALPSSLDVDFSEANKEISERRKVSMDYLRNSLKQ